MQLQIAARDYYVHPKTQKPKLNSLVVGNDPEKNV